ncbi:hypothetical protein [Sporosarcina sp. FSL W7-1283]|uniref:hypothetical protein n=1 Tax=Sporosarcina sp. FSL W7-1283 TaxID=2921560 RepID=UPI0030F55DB6
MIIEVDTIRKMRRHLNEPDADRFTDEDLVELLIDYPTFNKAVSVGWTIKAGMIQRELGTMDEYSTGDEKYKFTNLSTAINAALSMARQYDVLDAQTLNADASSMVLRFKAPDVI